MIEFGSDFHMIDDFYGEKSIVSFYPDSQFLANGRQCVLWLIKYYKWRRIWIPSYFCYEVVDAIKNAPIEVAFYEDSPLADDTYSISKIDFKKGDVLLRVNFFGLRGFRSNVDIPIPVIEDHSHDLIGEWAQKSDADWCIASLRKTIPIPEGGILWSPKGLFFENVFQCVEENESLAQKRWRGMELKKSYLQEIINDKNCFRNLYLDTEKEFERLPISCIDHRSLEYISSFDVVAWYLQKSKNQKLLSRMELSYFKILNAENHKCNPFSCVLLFEDKEGRDQVRENLIKRCVYPAILWTIPSSQSIEIQSIGDRILSVHCDGRYSEKDMKELKQIIESVL